MNLWLHILAAPPAHGAAGTLDEIAMTAGALLVAAVALWFLLRGGDEEVEEEGTQAKKERPRARQ